MILMWGQHDWNRVVMLIVVQAFTLHGRTGPNLDLTATIETEDLQNPWANPTLNYTQDEL